MDNTHVDQASLWDWSGARRRAGPRPNGFARALRIVVDYGRRTDALRAAPPEPKSPTKRCPRCGKQGDLLRDFGMRVMNGAKRPQSWCRACRANKPQARMAAL